MTQTWWLACLVLLTSLLSLSSCGGSNNRESQPSFVEDRELTAERRLARSAFENGQYAQAVTLYEKALARSYARDDVQMIGDIGYESALAFLRRGEPVKAGERVRDIATELSRRGRAPFAELYLVEAAALYVLGNPDQAQRALDATVAAPGAGSMVRARAEYMRGMIAADRGDEAALDQALAALGNPADMALRADRLELMGRKRLLRGETADALSAFQETTNLRRDTKDYVGVSRALAFSGDAAELAGRRADAADYYLRAGRAAQADGRPTVAKPWLEHAARLAREADQPSVLREARERLTAIANEASH